MVPKAGDETTRARVGTVHIPSRNVARSMDAVLAENASQIDKQAITGLASAIRTAAHAEEEGLSVAPRDLRRVGELDNLRSLEVPLSQALQARDSALLERLISGASDEIIQTTVERIHAGSVQPLMEAILDCIEANPSRAVKVTRWISCIMKEHTALLMTSPSARKEIMRLSQMAEERIRTNEALQALSGRLDLAIG